MIDDLADPAAPERIVAAAIRAFGRLDGLINNAALIGRSDLAKPTVELFDRVMAINIRAPLLLIKAAVPAPDGRAGAVLNIGSVNGLLRRDQFARLQHLERGADDAVAEPGRRLGGEVRVNHFNVGWVLTPNEYHYKIIDGFPPDWPEHVGPPEPPNTG